MLGSVRWAGGSQLIQAAQNATAFNSQMLTCFAQAALGLLRQMVHDGRDANGSLSRSLEPNSL